MIDPVRVPGSTAYSIYGIEPAAGSACNDSLFLKPHGTRLENDCISEMMKNKVRRKSSLKKLHRKRNDKPQGLGGKLEKVLPSSEE